MDHTNYIARSRASQEALKSAILLKSLNVNAVILGEPGVGKKTLAKMVLPNAPIVEGHNLQEVLGFIGTQEQLIINNFDEIDNLKKCSETILIHKTRIIATAKPSYVEALDDIFSLKITIDPLRDRPEDIEPLAMKFFQEVSVVFGFKMPQDICLNDYDFDVSQNCYSLRKSVYLKSLIASLSQEDVMEMMQGFLDKKIGGKNDYRDLLHLFDVPLLRAGFKKFHSQLAMSEKFGLNRNTLRKKINEYKNHFTLD